jgi:hypothetical protein
MSNPGTVGAGAGAGCADAVGLNAKNAVQRPVVAAVTMAIRVPIRDMFLPNPCALWLSTERSALRMLLK